MLPEPMPKPTDDGADQPGIYQLRGVDPALWRKIKAKAALEGITIRDLIEELLKAWLKESR